MSEPSRQELEDELQKLRALIAQTQDMGLNILELEDRAAEIEAQLAAYAGSEAGAATPAPVTSAAPAGTDTLKIYTPDLSHGNLSERPVALVGGVASMLGDHRAAISDVCVAEGWLPLTVAQLPAGDEEAVRAIHKVVDTARLYIGIFGYRYGRVSTLDGVLNGVGLVEVEYDRAVARGIPRLVCLMDKKHPITPQDIERGEGSAKLAALKGRLRAENDVHLFNSVEELRAQVTEALRRVPLSELSG